MESSDLVGVQVGENHPPYLVGIESAMLELGADLFLRLDPFLQSAPEARVPRREVARIGDAGRLPV